VAVLACLMNICRVKTVKLEQEDKKAMRERVWRVLDDCDLQLLLRMKDAERVRVRCVKV
jgi:hypothetical protein